MLKFWCVKVTVWLSTVVCVEFELCSSSIVGFDVLGMY